MHDHPMLYLRDGEAADAIAAMEVIVAWLRPQANDRRGPVASRMLDLQLWLRAHPQVHQRLAQR